MTVKSLTVPAIDFLKYAYGGDIDLLGHILTDKELIVWSKYLADPEVAVWGLDDDEESIEPSVVIEVDYEGTEELPLREYDDYEGPTILTEPLTTYQDVPVVSDFLTIAKVYA